MPPQPTAVAVDSHRPMTTLARSIVLQFALAGLMAGASFGQTRPTEMQQAAPGEAGMSAAKLDEVRSIMQAAVDKGKTAGVVVAIARHGKIVQLTASGKLDLESGRVMPTDAIFRIHSMTKPITTAAALLLAEDGKLELDAPVWRYLPEFKHVRVYGGTPGRTVDAQHDMTVRDLMRHTSGLTYGKSNASMVELLTLVSSGIGWDTTADMVAKVSKLPLKDQPGTRFNYGLSTDVLGRLIEVVSGQPLDVFMRRRVFQQLDMRDTDFFVPENKLDRFASSYRKEAAGLKATDTAASSSYRSVPTYLSGGGGLVSTARDYLRFCQMLQSGGELDGRRLLSPETVRMMTTNQLPESALPISLGGTPLPGYGFGLGMQVPLPSKTPNPAAGEYSWYGAASTYFWVEPRTGTIVVVLQEIEPMNLDLQLELKPVIDAAIAD